MSYYVYKHTFPNDKVYIGITCMEPEERWNGGKGYIGQSVMLKAILEFGWDNIEHEIVYEGLSEEEAEQKEIELIAKYNSNDSNFGYNVSDGGLVQRNRCVVEIHKPNYKKEKMQTLKIGVSELFEASKNLKKTSLQLYFYLCTNKNKDKVALLPSDVCMNTGMSKQSFYNARDELIEKGYIVYVGDDVYDFYTTPVEAQ